MDSNSDDSQRMMRRRDPTDDDDNNNDVGHRSQQRPRRLRTNGVATGRLLYPKKSRASSSSSSTATTSASRFLEYRNGSRHSSSSSFPSSSKSGAPMTLLLTVFVVTAVTVGVLEWMYLDQIPMVRHFPLQHVRRPPPPPAKTTNHQYELPPLFINNNNQNNNNNNQNQNNQNNNQNFLQVEGQGAFEPESRKLDVPLEMAVQQFMHFQQEPEEEILNFADTNTDYVRDPDKEPILKILRQAGVDTDELEKSVYDQLPTWSQVQELFGPKPIIYGMGEGERGEENCAAFRNSTDPTIRFFGIAGMFNSGTNLLASLMIQNCQITERMLVYGEKSKGVRWQVPWGKHTPAKYRMEHLTRTDKDVPVSNSLPLITIRDPYQWMQSMCRHPYTVRGMHDEDTCPHLIHSSYNPRRNTPITREDLNNIDVYYSNVIVRHATLAHFWNDWYHQYMEADYPRIFVRYEDLLFYGQEVTEQLCACGGGVPRRAEFTHIQDSAKVGHMAHGHTKTNLVEAMIRYGNFNHRLDHLSALDIELSKQLYDAKLMTMFNYHHPNVTPR